jgi:hypothetical protein
VLATVDFNDEALLKANEVENIALKRHLPTEFEEIQTTIPQQSPHCRFSLGRLTAHLFCEIADALWSWTMAWRLRHVPSPPPLRSATLSHKGRGKCKPGNDDRNGCYTRIGIST